MGCVKFPNKCDNVIIELIEDNARKVVETVIGDNAFKNPFGDKLDAINQKLSDISGVLPTDFPDIDTVQTELSAIKSSFNDFKIHADQISGIGTTIQEFTRRLSIASLENKVKEQLGLVADSYKQMFGAISCDIDNLLNSTTTQINTVINIIDTGGNLQQLIAGVTNLVTQTSIIAGQVTQQITKDINALFNAEVLLSKFNLASILITDDCFINTLLKDGIGSMDLLDNLQAAIDAKSRDGTILDVILNPSENKPFTPIIFEIPPEETAAVGSLPPIQELIPEDPNIITTPTTPKIVDQSQSPTIYVPEPTPQEIEKIQERNDIVAMGGYLEVSNALRFGVLDTYKRYSSFFAVATYWSNKVIDEVGLNGENLSINTLNDITSKQNINGASAAYLRFLSENHKKIDKKRKRDPKFLDRKSYELLKLEAAVKWIFTNTVLQTEQENIINKSTGEYINLPMVFFADNIQLYNRRNEMDDGEVAKTEIQNASRVNQTLISFVDGWIKSEIGVRLSRSEQIGKTAISPPFFLNASDIDLFRYHKSTFLPNSYEGRSGNTIDTTKEEQYLKQHNNSKIIGPGTEKSMMDFSIFNNQ